MLAPQSIAERALPGPRYTSYPPATELRPCDDVQPSQELRRLGGAGESVSLYVHIPFCRSLCWYCGCNVVPTKDRGRGTSYVDTLTTELVLLRRALGSGVPIHEICLGGGSPNFLREEDIPALLTAIERYLSVAPDARRSVELDPRDTRLPQIDAFAARGFRSLSVGVQDFSEPVQDAIRRHQSVGQTQKLLVAARSAGFDDIGIDIVYGLPRQTEESFLQTLHTIVRLGPDRIALFGYAHLPDRRPQQRLVEKGGRIPDTYERATLLVIANELLRQAGFIAIGLDHFAKPSTPMAEAATTGNLARGFQGYSVRRATATVGVGASAISTTPHQMWQNHSDLAAWESAIAAGKLPVASGYTLDNDDRIRRDVIERLMCDGDVSGAELGRRFGVDFAAYFSRELTELSSSPELVTIEKDRLRVSDMGRLLIRNVAMVFDRRAQSREGSFSSTI